MNNNISNITNASALLPIKGNAYTSTPSDDTPQPPPKYFDSDFTNSDFPLLWGTANGGRGDVSNLASIGVNFLHLYNWSVPPTPPNQTPGQYQRSHLSFLDECATNKVKVFVPISNYFLEQVHQGNQNTVASQIQAMVSEIYNGSSSPHPAAGIWGIGNEFDLAGGGFTINDVITVINLLLSAEQALNIPASSLLPITAPVSFAVYNNGAPGITAIQNLQQAFNTAGMQSVWNTRFIASTNPFNDGDYLATYIKQTFPKYFPDLPFFFTEMGTQILAGTPVTNEAQQAVYVLSQIQNCAPQGNFMGTCVFQFLNQSAVKSGTEATFGMTKYSGTSLNTGTIPQGYVPGGGQTYPVDALTQKPLYASVQTGFNSWTTNPTN